MSDKTPRRPTNVANTGFSPVTLPESPAAGSPQKNLTGLPRVVRDLAADVYNNIQRWNDIHIRGAALVKQIASIKADNPREFSITLEQIVNELYEGVQALKPHRDALLTCATQMQALNTLETVGKPLFISLNNCSLANLVEEISKAYVEEFLVKKYLVENISYSKNKEEAMFFAALWTYPTKITHHIDLKVETLLTETGHRKLT